MSKLLRKIIIVIIIIIICICIFFYINKSKKLKIGNNSTSQEIIDNILSNNTKQIEEYKNGKTNLFDYFVGQVMKETRGKANPVITKEILKDKLDN